MTKKKYYLIQWTWGFIMNFIGLFPLLWAVINKWPITKYRNAIMIEAPTSFGGVNFGSIFIIGKGCQKSAPHEYGHGLQNLKWGPLMPFVISIPSAVRYWYRRLRYTNKGLPAPTNYDSIWFEGQATELGKRAASNEWDWA